MASLAQLATLNNTAVEHLEQGNHKAAMEVFSKTLQLSKAWVDHSGSLPSHDQSHQQQSQQQQQQHQWPPQCNAISSPAAILRLDQCMAPFQENEHNQHNDDPLLSPATKSTDDISIYSQPIRLPVSYFLTNDYESATSTKNNAAVLCITTMFNLGLANQLCAREMQHVPQFEPTVAHLLQRAVQLYEWSYQFLISEGMENGAIVYTLATMNNLGWIYRSLNHHARSEQYFQHVLSTLLFLVDQQQTRQQSVVTTMPDSSNKANGIAGLSRKLDGFWNNVCLYKDLILKDTGASAA